LGGAYPGVLAEHVALDQDWLVHAPENLTLAEAACLPCAGVTAWFALVEEGKLQAGQTVLVHGTGGVSLLAMQIAMTHGAEVFVTSRSAAKLERVKNMGAKCVIDSSKVDWVASILAATGGRGIDHIVETIGGAHLGRSLEAAAERGRVSLVGVFEGGQFSGDFGSLALKHLKIEGIGVGHRRGLEDLVRAVEADGIKPVIDAAYPLDQLPAALDHLDRGPFGKVVVTL
jgi:NADPH:quinone reductase-like Zn-dependent oxidoreductase